MEGPNRSRAGRAAAAAGLGVAVLALAVVFLRVFLAGAGGVGRGDSAEELALLPNTLLLRGEDGRPVVGARCDFFSEAPSAVRRRVARAVSDERGLVDYDVPAWASPEGWLGLEVLVDDGVVAFRGRVASLRGARLQLSRQAIANCRLEGSIRLHDPRTTLWMTAVLAAGRDTVLGSSRTGRRDVNEFEASRIRFDDVDAARYAGAVELAALGVGDGEGLHVVARQRFASLHALRAAVRFGVELVADRRPVTVPAAPAVDELELRFRGRSHDLGFTLAAARFDRVALLEGEYAVLGRRGGRPVALGVLRVGEGEDARVHWGHRLPGPVTVTVALRDPLGRPPAAPVEVRWGDGKVWSEAARTNERGEVVVEGLPSRPLEFRARLDDLSASTRIQPTPATGRVTLRLRRRSAWVVEPRFPGFEPVDAHRTLQLFDWEPVLGIHEARTAPGHLGAVTTLEPGPTTLTLAGSEGWYGSVEVDVRGAGGVLEIPVRRLPRVRGQLTGEGVHRAVEVVVGSIDHPDLPRLAVQVAPDRSFTFVPKVPGPWVVAVRDYEGATLLLRELSGSDATIELR